MSLRRLATTEAPARLIGLLAASVILDGLDVRILSYAAPLILAEMHVSTSALGIVMAAAGLGMAIGTPIGGWAGDRVGYRPMILLSLAAFGFATVLTGMARTPVEVTLLRLVAGIGCGAITPNAYALLSGRVRPESRSTIFAVLAMGFPLGGLFSAIFTLWLLPQAGWRGTFVSAGAVTLVLLMLAVVWVPRGRGAPAPARIEAVPPARVSVLSPRYAVVSLAAAVFFFMVQCVSYAVTSWTPLIYTTLGLRLTDSVVAGLFFNLCAIIATFVVDPPLRRRGVFALTLWAAAITASLLLTLAWLLRTMPHQAGPGFGWLLIALIAGIGAGCGALFQVVNASTALAYPPEIRATGVGFCTNGGRIGAFVASLSGGLLLSWQGGSPTLLLVLMAGFAVLTVPAAALMRVRASRSPDDDDADLAAAQSAAQVA